MPNVYLEKKSEDLRIGTQPQLEMMSTMCVLVNIHMTGEKDTQTAILTALRSMMKIEEC